MKVLIVDDNRSVRLLLKTQILGIFANFLPEFVEAENVEDGLKNIKDKPDVLLLDLGFKEMTPDETIKAFADCMDDVPTIVFTGHDSQELAQKAADAGVVDYIVKGKLSSGSFQETNIGKLVFAIHAAMKKKISQEQLVSIGEKISEMEAKFQSAIDDLKTKIESQSKE